MGQFGENMIRMFELMFEKTVSAMVSVGTVVSVDKTTDTCVLSRDGMADMINVRLRSIVDSATSKVVLYPKVQSSVLYLLIENKKTEAYVFAVSEVEELFIKIGNQSFILNSNETVFNDGLNGGMVKATELSVKVNELVAKVNALITAYNAHIHVTTATVGATAVPGVLSPTVSQAQPAVPIDPVDFKNNKIKH